MRGGACVRGAWAIDGAGMSRHVLRRGGAPVRGFTLLELVTTITVAAILLAIAVPNFNHMINSHRLTTVANDLVTELTEARLEAIKLNSYTQLCSNSQTSNATDTLGTACGTSVGAVFEQIKNADGSVGAQQLLQPTQELSSGTLQVTTFNAVRYSGLGLGYKPGTSTPVDGTVADICSTSLSTNNHIQVVMSGGSLFSISSPFTATCP
jgi:type IV fimbrial biogenesis protein FimT